MVRKPIKIAPSMWHNTKIILHNIHSTLYVAQNPLQNTNGRTGTNPRTIEWVKTFADFHACCTLAIQLEIVKTVADC